MAAHANDDRGHQDRVGHSALLGKTLTVDRTELKANNLKNSYEDVFSQL